MQLWGIEDEEGGLKRGDSLVCISQRNLLMIS